MLRLSIRPGASEAALCGHVSADIQAECPPDADRALRRQQN